MKLNTEYTSGKYFYVYSDRMFPMDLITDSW